MKRQLQCATDPRPFRAGSENDPSRKPSSATRLATEVTFQDHHEHFVLKNTTFRAPAIIPNFTEYCACHEKWHFNFTKYCACHEKWIWWLILVTHETLFTMRGATGVIVQTHQILRLPRKMNLMIDPCHTWKAIYNARSNKCHCPNSPNTAPATKNESHDWSLSHMKRYSQCGATSVIVQTHQILRLPRKMTLQNFAKISRKQMKRQLQCATDPRPFRAGSENDPSRKPSSATRLATEVTFQDHHEHFVLKNTTFRAPAIIPNFTEYCACHEKWHFNFTKYCACHEKCISWLILVTHETLFTMRGATSVIVQTHQILRLPRKMILQNFQEICPKQMKRQFQCGTDPRMIRAGPEQDPSRIRAGSDHKTVSPQPASQPRLLFTPTTSILYWQIQHFALRLSFQISPNTAPATKSDASTSPNTAPATKSATWTSPNSAPATKSNTWTSPNSSPATKSDTWTPPNSAPATKSHTTLLLRISSQTNLISYGSNLLRISSQTNHHFSNESNLFRISSQTNLISSEFLLKRI